MDIALFFFIHLIPKVCGFYSHFRSKTHPHPSGLFCAAAVYRHTLLYSLLKTLFICFISRLLQIDKSRLFRDENNLTRKGRDTKIQTELHFFVSNMVEFLANRSITYILLKIHVSTKNVNYKFKSYNATIRKLMLQDWTALFTLPQKTCKKKLMIFYTLFYTLYVY